MPETAVHKDRHTASGQDNIWSAGKAFPVQPEPVAHAMQKGTDEQFGARILRADLGHEPTAGFRGDAACHDLIYTAARQR